MPVKKKIKHKAWSSRRTRAVFWLAIISTLAVSCSVWHLRQTVAQNLAETLTPSPEKITSVATVFTVNSLADTTDGACTTAVNGCTLREAIALAADGDSINFSSLFNTPQTINLLTALPDIDNSLTIQGTGANLLTVRRAFDAATDFSIFKIPAGVSNVAISGMTLRNGREPNGFGGGIFSDSNLTLTNVAVSGNQADGGGGVFLSNGDGTFTNSTFSSNTAGNQGGGIYFEGGGGHILRLVNSTVSGNIANGLGAGGGIYNFSGNGNSTLEIVNSTIANNSGLNGAGISTEAGSVMVGPANAMTTLRNNIIAGNTPNNLQVGTFNGGTATVASNGFNLSNNFNGIVPLLPTDITTATPLFGPLLRNGGETPTHVLLAGSPALDAGNSSGITTDQRGLPRAINTPGVPDVSDGSDIGAVEMQSLIVSTVTDSGAGSLRQAILDANANGAGQDDIIFHHSVFNSAQIITLTTGELVINSSLTMNGPGANLLTVSGNTTSRVFSISNGLTVGLSGMKLTGGNGVGTSVTDVGGAIFSSNSRTTISNCLIDNNVAKRGGGIAATFGNTSALTIQNSTISNNSSTDAASGGGIASGTSLFVVTDSTISGNTTGSGSETGGGIWVTNTVLTITNSTVTNNTASGGSNAGGIYADNGAAVSVRNSIIAGNANNSTVPDVHGSFTSSGFNLVGNVGTATGLINGVNNDQVGTGANVLDPVLGPLALNGGTTPTHALLSGSTAVDRGHSSGSLTDQRGSPRPVDNPIVPDVVGSDGADIGAYESQTVGQPAISINDVSQTEGNSSTSNFNFTVTLSVASSQMVSVTYASADGTANAPADYAALGPTFLDFDPGETSKTVTVVVNGDTTVESDETFVVNLSLSSNATISDNQGLGTILDDDSTRLQFSAMTYNVTEGDTATATVTRTGDASGVSTVEFLTALHNYAPCNQFVGAATQNCDYTMAAGKLTFAAGETSKTLDVLTNEDAYVEGDESFTATLANVTGGTFGSQNSTTFNITDNDLTGAPSVAQKQFVANLTGAQEVPPTGNNVIGNGGVVKLGDNETSANVSLFFQGLTGTQNGAHIHGPADPGVNANILFDLPLGSPVLNFLFNPSAGQVADLKVGRHYINIHSTTFPNGEIRGQLLWNAVEETGFIVRQQYADFLSRRPDPGGFNFWSGQLDSCVSDVVCLRNRRTAIANAFFFEPEFQQTGSYVVRLYRAAFGNTQPFPNPDNNPAFLNENLKYLSYEVFVRDRARVVGGANQAQSQLDLANEFVLRPAFIAKYPASLATADQFVDAVLATLQTDLGVNLTAQKPGLITLFNQGGRGAVMYRLVDDNPQTNPINNQALLDAEYNRSFVAAEYFGYLRRDGDIGGLQFWLGQVNRFPVRNVAIQQAMVCSFITSAEYQLRFGPTVTRTNAECPQ